MFKALDRLLPEDIGELSWTGILFGAFASQVCGPGVIMFLFLLPDSIWTRIATVVLLVVASIATALSLYIAFKAWALINRRQKELETLKGGPNN